MTKTKPKAGAVVRGVDFGSKKASAGSEKQINATTIVRELLRQISRGAYKPGDRIREQEIAAMFQISRSPVREAFRLLEAKGVLEFAPMRGVTVAEVSPAEAKELVDISAVLFGLAARYAAVNAVDEERTRIIAAARELDANATAKISAKKFFYLTLIAGQQVVLASKTKRIAKEVIDSRLGAPDLLGPQCFETLEARRRVAAMWIELADAICQGEGARAQTVAVDIHAVASRYALADDAAETS